MLKKNLSSGSGTDDSTDLVGKSGAALTPLRPAGTAQIEGRKIDVVAESDFIESGDPVEVVFREGLRVVVRKKRAA